MDGSFESSVSDAAWIASPARVSWASALMAGLGTENHSHYRDGWGTYYSKWVWKVLLFAARLRTAGTLRLTSSLQSTLANQAS
jgi:hypothetical protein